MQPPQARHSSARCWPPPRCCWRPAEPARSGSDDLTLYNGQHEQTTAALVSAFERQSGIKVERPLRRRGHARQPDPAGGRQLPGRRLLQREHAGAGSACASTGCSRRSAPSTLAAVPSRYSSPRGRLGRGLGARLGARLQHRQADARRSCPSSILELAEPKWRGKLGFAPSETDFQPLITSVIRFDGAAAGGTLAEGAAGERHGLPRQRDGRRAGQQRRERSSGPINHYYWYRLREEVGAGGMHSALTTSHPGDPGDLRRRLRRGDAAVEHPPGGGTGVPRVPGQPRRARR